MFNIIIFAVLAYVFYSVYKSYNRYESYSQEAFKDFSVSHEALKRSELGLFVALVAKLAKADGKVDALEAQLVGIMFDDISAVFPQAQKTKQILKDIFNEEKDRTDNVEQIVSELARLIKRDKAKQQQFMGFLIQLAFVDGECSKNEEELLQDIAQTLEFDPNTYHAIFDKFEKMMQNMQPQENISDAYKLLGVNENDDMKTIKKAYKKLIRQYHPDIIASQGKSEAYMQEATEKTQEINRAYEMIEEARK